MRKSRSRVHMLTVAAASVEGSFGNEKLVADLRAAAKLSAERLAQGQYYDDKEQKRIDRQRTLFSCLSSNTNTDRLREAMMQRAYDMMWDGLATECDAILEFLPSRYADEVLDGWENDQDGNKPRSRFYEGNAA